MNTNIRYQSPVQQNRAEPPPGRQQPPHHNCRDQINRSNEHIDTVPYAAAGGSSLAPLRCELSWHGTALSRMIAGYHHRPKGSHPPLPTSCSLKLWWELAPACGTLHLDVHPACQAPLVKHVVARREHVVLQSAVHSSVADRASGGGGGRGGRGRGRHDSLVLFVSRKASDYDCCAPH